MIIHPSYKSHNVSEKYPTRHHFVSDALWDIFRMYYGICENGLFIKSAWCLYASVNQAIIGSNKSLSPVWCQAITWLNADVVNWTWRYNGRHFPDAIFKWIFLNENVWISINILLKFVPRGPINNIPTLVQVMAWHHPGAEPLSEPMMVRLCVTRPQWVNFIN